MSQYFCPECDEKTSVIDTRPSNKRLRRRRKCPNGHRFSTIEVPLTAREEITLLILWSLKQLNNDTDTEAYIRAEMERILNGSNIVDKSA